VLLSLAPSSFTRYVPAGLKERPFTDSITAGTSLTHAVKAEDYGAALGYYGEMSAVGGNVYVFP
jgi:hypothetical protein